MNEERIREFNEIIKCMEEELDLKLNNIIDFDKFNLWYFKYGNLEDLVTIFPENMKIILNEQVKIINKLKHKLNNKQLKSLNRYIDLENILYDKYCFQALVINYIFSIV